MTEVTLHIDGREIKAKEGEFILNIARANDIFIPAICYLTRCSPTLACRLCLVDIDGKRAYSCNAKAKDGMNIITHNEEIQEERRAIMEVYDINHPLQCGVCDQSGECELQNYTLELGVNSQNYSIKDTFKPAQDWGIIHYDPALCIVCERCISVCKDMIGDSALKTVKRNGEEIDPKYKESMPKDSYAIWNKMNKNLIGTASGDKLDCSDCAECVSVCPVGALVTNDFQYKSNAWELDSIPATCSHCSMGCQIKYDVKNSSIENPEKKVFRVTNEFHYVSLCGAGRFGYDFENRAIKNEQSFNSAIDAFNKADTIHFSSYITNEEALILQRLKEKYGYKLVNSDALNFKKFLQNYSSTSGKSLYSSDLRDVRDSNFIISVGSFLKNDAPNARYALNNALTLNKGAGLYFHPLGDLVIEGLSKNIMPIYHKPLVEEQILYLILELFGKDLPKDVSDYLATFKEKRVKKVVETIREDIVEKVKDENGVEKEVTKSIPKKVEKEIEVEVSKLAEIIGLNDSFDDEFQKLLAKKDSFSLILGDDLITHPKSQNLAKLAGLIDRYTDFNVLIIPSKTNTLGVSLICDLDESCGEYTIGYNANGDFRLSALGDGELDIPALNQQEGTFVSVDKRVVPINVALEYNGYILNDIANALEINSEYTINYTKELPTSKGFKAVKFDDLDNSFSNAQEDNRGYLIDSFDVKASDIVESAELIEMGSEVVYLANPLLQFSEFTNNTTNLKDEAKLYCSAEFLETNALSESDVVELSNKKATIKLKIAIDSKLKGNIPYIPTFDKNVDSLSLFDGYRFSEVKIKKV
jgi:NADH-quinone oxidoreductase subunit G